MNNNNVPHIVQYQGSKRLLASQILNYMPRRFNRLIEPFAGMAAVTIAVSKQKRAQSYILNDLNQPLVSLLQTAIENPTDLIRQYSQLWQEQFDFEGGSLAHYYNVRDRFNGGEQTAVTMLYLLARCVKGSVRYSNSGQFNQSPDKRRNGTSPKTLQTNVNEISYYLKGKTHFFSKDYKDILKEAQPGDVVYMDPPYQGVSNVRDSRYYSGIEFDDFVKAIEDLNGRGIDFLISYDGLCGTKKYGFDLPAELGLQKVLLNAGLSSQGILLGKKETTFEALYISPGLQQILPKAPENVLQTSLFEAYAA